MLSLSIVRPYLALQVSRSGHGLLVADLHTNAALEHE
jgi:hypothetical protein